jgi:hypothetical protein
MSVLASDPVLDAAAVLRQEPRPDDERALREIKRALVAAVKQSPLLIATQNGAPALFPAVLVPLEIPEPRARVALAFTDDEAVSAWRAHRHPAMPDVTVEPSTSLGGGSVPGRRAWLGWLPEQRGPGGGLSPAVVINPAGPLGCFVTRQQLQQSMLGRGPAAPEGAGSEWRDLEFRLRERARSRELVDAFERAASEGDMETANRLAAEPRDRLKNPLESTRLRVIGARRQHALGNLKPAIIHMAAASGGYAFFGDPYSGIDVLLEVYPWIAEANLSETEEKLAQTMIQRRLRALELPYRAEEVGAILGCEWPPGRPKLARKFRKARWQGEPGGAPP